MDKRRVNLLDPIFRNGEWAALVRANPGDLRRDEFFAVLPPLGTRGSAENVIRFARVSLLKILGFTVEGKTPSLAILTITEPHASGTDLSV